MNDGMVVCVWEKQVVSFKVREYGRGNCVINAPRLKMMQMGVRGTYRICNSTIRTEKYSRNPVIEVSSGPKSFRCKI